MLRFIGRTRWRDDGRGARIRVTRNYFIPLGSIPHMKGTTMSKSNLFDQPGIEKLLPGADLPVAVKVTGRNLHAVSLLVSLQSEELGERAEVSARFETDGSLDHVLLISAAGRHEVKAGDYLILSDDKKTIVIASPEDYAFFKTLFPILGAVDSALESLIGVLA